MLAWAGVGHWVVYRLGIVATYSCLAHGLVQVQAFLLSFAIGFLLTALPRRTSSAAPATWEIAAIAFALAGNTVAALLERLVLAEACYALVFVLLLRFAVSRFLGRAAGRRPPAAFVLIPIAAAQGIGGAVLIALSTASTAPAWTESFGRLLVEQGVFLCLVMAVGSLILPLMSGASPPPDLGSTPRESRRAAGYAIAGLAVVGSLVAEELGHGTAASLVRAVAVAIGFSLGEGVLRPPGKPGLHRKLAWIAVWTIPVGLVLAGLWPDYRVPALHVVFIGGFSLLAFAVATHVSLTHLGHMDLSLGRPAAVVALAAALGLALAARLAADWSEAYFDHLAWAAGAWLVGTGVWLAFLAPKLVRRAESS